ncbi:hypothetical protein D9M72_437150 [compost metagenome]
MLGQRGDLEERRDAAHPRRVRHQVVRRAMADQLAVFGRARQHFAGRDRRVELRRQRGVALVVIGIQRLLDPDEVEGLEGAAHALRRGAVPLLVCVDHQRHRVAELLAHGRHAPDVERAVRLPNLELDPADATLYRSRRVDQQLVQRRVQEATGGVVAAYGIPMGTQQLCQRQVCPLRLQVPERDIECPDGLRRQSAAPDRRTGPAELVPQFRDVIGVFADQCRGDFAGVGKLPGPAGALGVAEADTFMALGGPDLGKEDGHLGHRLLAAGQNLGVADRRGQREIARREPDRGNGVGRSSGRGRHGMPAMRRRDLAMVSSRHVARG